MLAVILFAASGCSDAQKEASRPPTRTMVGRATVGAGSPAHQLYEARGLQCAVCHPCGERIPGGHAVAWMDQASPEFHAFQADRDLASCQVCHGAALDGVSAQVAVSCAQCHGAGWRTDCAACHGSAGSAGAPPRTVWGQSADAVRVGAHAAHLGATHALSKPVACDVCHVVPADALAPAHANGATADVRFSGYATNVPDPAQITWNRAGATCNGTYCHGATLGGLDKKVPVWTRADGTDRSCTACHGDPPPPPHVQNSDCNLCHTGYTSTSVVSATHVDGKLDVAYANLACNSCHGSAANAAPPRGTANETDTTAIAVGAHQRHLLGGAVSGPIACGECHVVPAPDDMGHANGSRDVAFGPLARSGGAAPLWTRAAATCTLSYCHGQFQGGNPLSAPVWTKVDGSQAACGTCHGLPPAEPHPQNPACESCHDGYTATSVNLATHVNGLVEVKPLTCHSCHGSATSDAPPIGTHGETSPTARAVGAHQAHLTGGTLGPAVACAECHAVPTSMTHADGAVQVAMSGKAALGGATPVYDAATMTCSGTYCHGAVLRGGGTNLAPTWNAGVSQVTCGSCHTTPPPAPHPHTAVCENCHPGYTTSSVNLATHMNGKVEAENLTCSSCHGDDSRVLTMGADPNAIAAPPYGSRGETQPSSRSVGSHQAHVNGGHEIALPSKCRYCHVVPTTTDHSDGVSQVTFGSLATMGGANPTFDGNTCKNTYCHGATLGRGGTNHEPSWVNPEPVTCTTCHGAPPPLPHPQDSDCIRCHPGYTQTTVRKWTHVNGISDFPSSCNSCHDDPPNTGAHYEHLQERVTCDRCHAGYTMTSENPALHRNAKQDVTLSGWNASTRTCSNIGCHGSEYWGRNGSAARTSCNQCHGVPPSSGEHYEHKEYACSRCHGTGYSTTTTGATHMNGAVDVPFAFYDRTRKTCGSGTGSCHGSEPWGLTKPVTPNCGNCHGFPPPLPHPQQNACGDCHPSMTSSGVLTSTHNNGTLDITGHGCESCHGFPPSTTRAGGVHPADANCYGCHPTTVNAQNQVVPDGTHNDGAVEVGGGGIGTYGCQTCHGDQARTLLANADPQAKAAPPLGTRGETEPTTRAVGAHVAHLNRAPADGAIARPAACAECHLVPTAMDHANGVVVNTFSGRAVLQGASPQFELAGFTCQSTYCHGATLGAGGTNHAPSWNAGAAEAACGTCHGVPPPAPHPQSANCGGCHDGYSGLTVNVAAHVNGVVEVSPLACNSCHGGTANAAPPFGTNGETLTTTLSVGAHQQHLLGGPLTNPIACGECHVVPTSTSHADGAAQVTFGALARTGGAAPAWDPATATCRNTYCHGQFTGGALLNAPSWTTVNGTQAACGTCHGLPPPAPHSTNASCGSCHDGYTATTVNLATHVNGTVEARASPHAAGYADKAQHGYQSNVSGFASCKSCHGADLASCTTCHASAGFASWDTSCTFCHGNRTTGAQSPPVDVQGRTVTTNVSVGAHASHGTTTIAAAIACAQCHPARTASVVTDAAHVDGNGIAEVAFGALAKTGNVTPVYTRTSATAATCASTYCHGRFSGGVNSGTGATMSWTSTTQVGCTSCHGNPPSTGHHSTHSGRAACTNCHNAVVNASNGFVDRTLHVNGARNVKLGGTYGGRTVTGTWNATSRSCSSLSCHGSATW